MPRVILLLLLVSNTHFAMGESPDKILSEWKARGRQLNKVKVEWDEKTRHSAQKLQQWAALSEKYAGIEDGKDYTGPGSLLYANGKYRFLTTRNSVLGDNDNQDCLYVYDGKKRGKLVVEPESAVVEFTKMEGRDHLNSLMCFPLMAYLDPLRVLPKSDWAFIQKDLVRNNKRIAVIQSNGFEVWVDSTSDDALPIRIIRKDYGRVTWESKIEYSESAGRFLPSKWETTTYDGDIVMTSISAVVTSFDFDPAVERSDFEFEIPVGAFVYDNRSGFGPAQRVAPDGSLEIVGTATDQEESSYFSKYAFVSLAGVGLAFMAVVWVRRRFV